MISFTNHLEFNLSKLKIDKQQDYLVAVKDSLFFSGMNDEIIKICIDKNFEIIRKSTREYGSPSFPRVTYENADCLFYYSYPTNKKTEDHLLCVSKIDMDLNTVWSKDLSITYNFFKCLPTENEELYFSAITKIESGEMSRIGKFNTYGDIEWEHIIDTGEIVVNNGCCLSDNKVMSPIKHDGNYTEFKIFDDNGIVLNTIPLQYDASKFFSWQDVELLQDSNRNVLITACYPAKEPLFIPGTVFMITDSHGNFLHRTMRTIKTMIVYPIVFYDDRYLICCYSGYNLTSKNIPIPVHELSCVDLMSNKDRLIYPLHGNNTVVIYTAHHNYHYIVAYPKNENDKNPYTPERQSLFVFDQQFNLLVEHPLRLNDSIIDIKIIGGYVVILTTISIKILKIIHG